MRTAGRLIPSVNGTGVSAILLIAITKTVSMAALPSPCPNIWATRPCNGGPLTSRPSRHCLRRLHGEAEGWGHSVTPHPVTRYKPTSNPCNARIIRRNTSRYTIGMPLQIPTAFLITLIYLHLHYFYLIDIKTSL